MSSFVLKIIACITMFIGHVPFVFPTLTFICVSIGKIAFPIFAFLISEGYVHTKNWRKYLKRLLSLALISQIPAYLLFKENLSGIYLNIFFTLSLGLLTIRLIDKIKNKYLNFIIITFIAFIAEISGCDFGAIGILMIIAFFINRNNKFSVLVSELVLMMILYLGKFASYTVLTILNFRYILLQLLFSISSLFFIFLYNGKRGKDSRKIKSGFYFFYPIHLIFLCLLKYL